jgi:hypothetical protein
MAETTQVEQTTPVSYNLNLSDVPYDEKYRLNQASTTQLVKGLHEMAGRLADPTNEYQKELYPALKTIVNKFSEKYTSLLQCSSEVEREVKRFNLHGYSGKIKNPVSTKGVKYNLVYKFANFGDYLKTVTQRMKYLVERQVPQRYVTNTAEGTAYTALKTQLQEFVKYMTEEVEQSWNTAVTSARTAGGSSVQENLRKRTEKQQSRVQGEFKKFKKVMPNKETTTESSQTNHYGQPSQQKPFRSSTSRGRGGFRGGRGASRGGGQTTRTQWTARKSS